MSKRKPEVQAPKYKPGDMVFMHNDPSEYDPGEAPPDEVGEVDGAEGWDYENHCVEAGSLADRFPGKGWMYVVTVPKNLRDKDDRDGLREVHEDQLSYYRPIGKKQASKKEG
jgi:hypothetical protein